MGEEAAAQAVEAVVVNWAKVAAAGGLAVAAVGSALALGKAVSTGLESMARQPEIAGQIQTAMIIGAAFIEALTIYALVAFAIA